MKWSEIRIHTTNEAVEPISNILHEAGASGVVIEDPADLIKGRDAFYGEIFELNPADYPEEGVYIKAYLLDNQAFENTANEIQQAINGLAAYDIDVGRNEVTVSEVHEEQWATAWKKYYKPVRISEHVTVVPTWEDYTPVNDKEVIIELDPGMAFGTGTHPTTILSVQAIEKFTAKGDTVVDVGSGSGVLSIAAALLEAEKVYAYDLDEVAVTSTTMNAALNSVEDKITAKQNDLLKQVEVEADVIVSNILAEIILKFIADAYNCLKPGGFFITSGIIQAKKQQVEEAILAAGFEIMEVNQIEDWIAIIAKKA